MSNKNKICLISDDIRSFSGVGGMAREIVLGTVHKYDYCCLGGLVSHPESGKQIDMSAATQQITKVPDAKVVVYPTNGYGDENILFNIFNIERPNAILIFTDPRFFYWLFILEKQIRNKIPILYLNIWDACPYPQYNRPFYESCDLLMSISQQTYQVNKSVLYPENCMTMEGYFDKDGNLIPFEKTDINQINITQQ